MNPALIKYNEDNYLVSILVSIILHALIIISAVFIFNVTVNKSSKANSYVQVFTEEFQSIVKSNPIEAEETTNITSKIKSKLKEKIKLVKEVIVDKNESLPKDNVVSFLNFSDTNVDTTNLDQIYREATFNVSMRYPKGWTYIDQNIKDKLDGVTFWSLKGRYNPPPYIHLEVKEKYLFNESRYKNKKSEKNYVIYYNDPVELAGQITQILYIRTDEDEDFSIKLIMNNKDSFKTFQPEFFGMIKTFKFGKQYF